MRATTWRQRLFGAAAVGPASRAPSPVAHFVWAVVVSVLCTLVCTAMFPRFHEANLVMVYLAGVSMVAVRFGRWPSVLAAALSVTAFNFFFVPPYFTLAVSHGEYVVTFGVMLAVALLISELAVRLRNQAEAARHREQRTQLLYATSRELASLTDAEEVWRAACRHVATAVQGDAGPLLPDGEGRLSAATADLPFAIEGPDRAAAERAFRDGGVAGRGTGIVPEAVALYLAVVAGPQPRGVLAVRPHENLLPLSSDSIDLLETLARLVAASLERARLAAVAEMARVDAERERLRSALLSSVSHDLRTPLAVITGAATSLLETSTAGRRDREELLETIREEAFRLNQVVGNLLDMTRLESGAIRLNRDWHSVEELVGSALARTEDALASHRVEAFVPSDLLLQVDALLMERVLVNLLDNAARHTPAGSTVRICAIARDGTVEMEIADDGPGLPAGEEQRVFEKFFRRAPQRRAGFGLGLAICRAIVDAHGGRVEGQNRPGHGALFRIALPVAGTPPQAPSMDAPDERVS